jgi:hypothetical protein
MLYLGLYLILYLLAWHGRLSSQLKRRNVWSRCIVSKRVLSGVENRLNQGDLCILDLFILFQKLRERGVLPSLYFLCLSCT